jgi:K+-transporting ATPase KdpF subunit
VKNFVQGGEAMTIWAWIGAGLALGLLIYLVAVLLKPEDFS